MTGFTTGIRLGTAIAGIGDYDADGFSDMIVSGQQGIARFYRGGVDPMNVDNFTVPLDVIVESITSCDWDMDGRSDPFFGGDFFGIFDTVESLLATDVNPGTANAVPWLNELGHALAAGDVNGDGYPDVVSGDPDYILVAPDDGRIEVRYGNTDDDRALAPRDIVPRARTTFLDPIALQGTTPETNAYLLRMRGISAAGRTDVRLEWQAVPMGTPFAVAPNAGPWVDTGAPDATASAVSLAEGVTGLPLDARIRWRVRVASRSPYFPRTPWFTNAPATTALWHFRTPATMVAVEPGEPVVPAGLRVTQAAPNPFRSRSSVLLTLDRPGVARVDVVDVSGRHVAGLVNGPLRPGEHRIGWDGRTGRGARASAGVYYVRLDVGGQTSVRRVVLVR